MNRIKVCIVGCGRISTLQSLAYKDHPDAEIYAVCDLNEARAKEKKQQSGELKRFIQIMRRSLRILKLMLSSCLYLTICTAR
ncbi:MAG: hypothetical protein ACOX7R_01200 [Acetivibrionales bacterium]